MEQYICRQIDQDVVCPSKGRIWDMESMTMTKKTSILLLRKRNRLPHLLVKNKTEGNSQANVAYIELQLRLNNYLNL